MRIWQSTDLQNWGIWNGFHLDDISLNPTNPQSIEVPTEQKEFFMFVLNERSAKFRLST
jgi:hypothetical protein